MVCCLLVSLRIEKGCALNISNRLSLYPCCVLLRCVSSRVIYTEVPFLSNAKTGLVYHLDEIYETKDTKAAWEDSALRHNVDLSIPIQKEWNILESELTGVIQGRSFPRRFDMSKVIDQTKQRVCEHSLLDYCCLNRPLPPPCQDLYCKLSYGTGEDNQQRRLQIQPWTFPTSSSKEVSDSRV